MPVAAVYDIHGNLPALEAVLDDINQTKVDCIVVGGDVMPGPMPRETLACLLRLDLPIEFISGNGEVAVLTEMAGRDPAVPDQARESIRWTAVQLLPEQQKAIASWPKTLRLEISGFGNVLFCHATPRSEDECFTRLTPEDRLRPLFDGLGVSLVICGHTHMQFDRMIGRTRVVNAGSIGMPFGKPGASWLLLGPDLQFRHTRYNLEEAAARIRATGYPKAGDFAARYVLQPPSEEAMLEALTKAELKRT